MCVLTVALKLELFTLYILDPILCVCMYARWNHTYMATIHPHLRPPPHGAHVTLEHTTIGAQLFECLFLFLNHVFAFQCYELANYYLSAMCL